MNGTLFDDLGGESTTDIKSFEELLSKLNMLKEVGSGHYEVMFTVGDLLDIIKTTRQGMN